MDVMSFSATFEYEANLIATKIFKNVPTPPLFRLFYVFLNNIITIFTANKCEECPCSIQCPDSNPWPLEHESPPIATWPGLPPNFDKNFMEVTLSQMLGGWRPWSSRCRILDRNFSHFCWKNCHDVCLLKKTENKR